MLNHDIGCAINTSAGECDCSQHNLWVATYISSVNDEDGGYDFYDEEGNLLTGEIDELEEEDEEDDPFNEEGFNPPLDSYHERF